jgi:hypothetical protein
MPQLQLPLPNTNTNIACTFAFMATPCCSCYCPCLTLTQTHSSFDPSSHTHTCHVNRRSAHSHSISFRSKNSTPALFTSFTRTSDTLRPTVCCFHVWACGGSGYMSCASASDGSVSSGRSLGPDRCTYAALVDAAFIQTRTNSLEDGVNLSRDSFHPYHPRGRGPFRILRSTNRPPSSRLGLLVC